jgi:hypothetical protein
MLAALALVLQILVSPTVSFAPSTLNVKIRVEPRPENRLLVWSLIGGEFATESRRQLEGEASPKTFFMPQWKDVPPGTYVAVATVYSSTMQVLQRATANVVVKGFE